MKPKLRRLLPTRITLCWEKEGGSRTHIGYHQAPGLLFTPRGSFSEKVRLNCLGKTTEPKNKMHMRRVGAAATEDGVYRGA